MLFLSTLTLLLLPLALSALLEPPFKIPNQVVADLKGMEYLSNRFAKFVPEADEKSSSTNGHAMQPPKSSSMHRRRI